MVDYYKKYLKYKKKYLQFRGGGDPPFWLTADPAFDRLTTAPAFASDAEERVRDSAFGDKPEGEIFVNLAGGLIYNLIACHLYCINAQRPLDAATILNDIHTTFEELNNWHQVTGGDKIPNNIDLVRDLLQEMAETDFSDLLIEEFSQPGDLDVKAGLHLPEKIFKKLVPPQFPSLTKGLIAEFALARIKGGEGDCQNKRGEFLDCGFPILSKDLFLSKLVHVYEIELNDLKKLKWELVYIINHDSKESKIDKRVRRYIILDTYENSLETPEHWTIKKMLNDIVDFLYPGLVGQPDSILLNRAMCQKVIQNKYETSRRLCGEFKDIEEKYTKFIKLTPQIFPEIYNSTKHDTVIEKAIRADAEVPEAEKEDIAQLVKDGLQTLKDIIKTETDFNISTLICNEPYDEEEDVSMDESQGEEEDVSMDESQGEEEGLSWQDRLRAQTQRLAKEPLQGSKLPFKILAKKIREIVYKDCQKIIDQEESTLFSETPINPYDESTIKCFTHQGDHEKIGLLLATLIEEIVLPEHSTNSGTVNQWYEDIILNAQTSYEWPLPKYWKKGFKTIEWDQTRAYDVNGYPIEKNTAPITLTHEVLRSRLAQRMSPTEYAPGAERAALKGAYFSLNFIRLFR